MAGKARAEWALRAGFIVGLNRMAPAARGANLTHYDGELPAIPGPLDGEPNSSGGCSTYRTIGDDRLAEHGDNSATCGKGGNDFADRNGGSPLRNGSTRVPS